MTPIFLLKAATVSALPSFLTASISAFSLPFFRYASPTKKTLNRAFYKINEAKDDSCIFSCNHMRLRERALDTGQIVLKIGSIDEGIGVKISLQPKSKHCIKAALFMVRRFITAPFSNLSFGLDESPLSVKEGTKRKQKCKCPPSPMI